MDLTGEAVERFWAKVEVRGPDECWPWTAARKPNGYGQFMFGGRVLYAHRIAQTLAAGPIPADRIVHHRCESKACCNPAHLELVTQSGHKWLHPNRTGCRRHGEEFMVRGAKSGVRYCQECNRGRVARWKARHQK